MLVPIHVHVHIHLYMNIHMQLLDHVGVVEELLQDGELYVRYPNNSLLPVSPQGANKVSVVSQFVVIISITTELNEQYIYMLHVYVSLHRLIFRFFTAVMW